jgi:hypothetical protein
MPEVHGRPQPTSNDRFLPQFPEPQCTPTAQRLAPASDAAAHVAGCPPEDNFASTQRIAREAIGLSQAFPTNATATRSTQQANAFRSQAKTTLTWYSKGSDSVPQNQGRRGDRPFTCYRYGGPHAYLEYWDGTTTIICPNRNNRGVKENAACNLEKMRKNKKKRYIHNIKCKNIGTVNYADLPEATRQRMREQILLGDVSDGTSMMSSVTNTSTLTPSAAGCGRGRSNGNGVVFLINVPCLATDFPLKKMMPITIQSTLPHIVLQFGLDMDTADCPSICCAVDTCVALTTGNFHFFSTDAKHYPHCLAKILAPANYAPIVLSGIVQYKDKAVTTKLESVFSFTYPTGHQGAMPPPSLLQWIPTFWSTRLLDYRSLK